MAAVTFDTLEAFGRTGVTSEAVANAVSGYKRWTTVNGPFKTEYNYYQCGETDTFTDGDTFQTSLAHPITVSVQSVGVNLGDTAFPGSANLEGVESDSDFRRVTVNDANDTAAAGIMVIVYGY